MRPSGCADTQSGVFALGATCVPGTSMDVCSPARTTGRSNSVWVEVTVVVDGAGVTSLIVGAGVTVVVLVDVTICAIVGRNVSAGLETSWVTVAGCVVVRVVVTLAVSVGVGAVVVTCEVVVSATVVVAGRTTSRPTVCSNGSPLPLVTA